VHSLHSHQTHLWKLSSWRCLLSVIPWWQHKRARSSHPWRQRSRLVVPVPCSQTETD
jgi:hypothetical protein